MKTKPPSNGYYLCTRTISGQGEVKTAVKIKDGKAINYLGERVPIKQLHRFIRIPTIIYVRYFSADAAKELIALRKFKAACMSQINH